MSPLPASDLRFKFDNSYFRMPERFYVRQHPTAVRAAHLIRLNGPLAQRLGLDPDALRSPAGTAIFAGNLIPDGALPIATAYAGHQFGGFSPQLGDGRAVLLGEIVTGNGERFDLQLKGSGPTPFSRRGDGRAALGPVLREYVVSEAMAALGIPTTRALAAVSTGEDVMRETPLPGGVLTRVASSHIRVGTFQYFAARGDVDGVRRLAEHVIERHFPELAQAPHRYVSLLDAVIARQASLVAKWMLVGFIHGVMNTDNTSITGETIDYGPCAFVDAYDPAAVYSSIDYYGRYAFGNQPTIAQWNLTRLAECLLPLIDVEQDTAIARAQTSLDAFQDLYSNAYFAGLSAKLGLSESQPDDLALGKGLLDRMAKNRADFTLTFRTLCDAAISPDGDKAVRNLFERPQDFDEWAVAWRRRLAMEKVPATARRDAMRAVNPAIIPRNHNVEAAISAAVGHGDFGSFNRLVDVLAAPYDAQPDAADLMTPPRPEEVVRATFCGT